MANEEAEPLKNEETALENFEREALKEVRKKPLTEDEIAFQNGELDHSRNEVRLNIGERRNVQRFIVTILGAPILYTVISTLQQGQLNVSLGVVIVGLFLIWLSTPFIFDLTQVNGKISEDASYQKFAPALRSERYKNKLSLNAYKDKVNPKGTKVALVSQLYFGTVYVAELIISGYGIYSNGKLNDWFFMSVFVGTFFWAIFLVSRVDHNRVLSSGRFSCQDKQKIVFSF